MNSTNLTLYRTNVTYMDRIEIDDLVQKRIEYRMLQQYDEADKIKKHLEKNQVLIVDLPRNVGGGSTWRRMNAREDISLIELSKTAYLCNGEHSELFQKSINNAKSYLRTYMAREYDNELHGRKFVDAAFTFALAGSDDEELYDLLFRGALLELNRIGKRASCKAVDLYHLCCKLACAGIRSQEYFQACAVLIKNKSSHDNSFNIDKIQLLESDSFSLLCEDPLLTLFKFSVRQKKEKIEINSDLVEGGSCILKRDMSSSMRFENIKFKDKTLPLIIDLGCGFGVSLIGLCIHNSREETRKRQCTQHSKQSFNYLGCDLSSRCISFASSIARRWNIDDSCNFVKAESSQVLKWVKESYLGPVKWIFIQFPTPYSQSLMNSFFNTSVLEGKSVGNSQLAQSLDEFLFSPDLLEIIVDCLNEKGCVDNSGIFFQTNVEDVAIVVREIIEARKPTMFVLLPFSENSNPHLCDFEDNENQLCEDIRSNNLSQRGKKWRELGGLPASGKGWLTTCFLPHGRTETEVSYMVQNKPIYRCAFNFLH